MRGEDENPPQHELQGQFKHTLQLDKNLQTGNSVIAHTSIFGDFYFKDVKIDYRGLNTNDAKRNFGLQSGWSNGLVVGEKPEVPFEVAVVNPVAKCSNVWITSYYGWRKDPLTSHDAFHSGIDLAQLSGCVIVSAFKGDALIINNYGNGLDIKHSGGYITRYGHGAELYGSFPRKVNTSEDIMYMGNTGRATGVHLHFELFKNGENVNPWDYFGHYFQHIPVYII